MSPRVAARAVRAGRWGDEMSDMYTKGLATGYVRDGAPGVLRGNLADIGPSQVLNLIHFAKKSGTLRFFQPHTERSWMRGAQTVDPVPGDVCGAITFERGAIIRASSSAGEMHLADILYAANKLDAQQVYLIREWGGELSEKALALTLINGNYVTHAGIVSSIVQHTLDCVFEIMTWREAFFVFEEGTLPGDDTLTVSINTQHVIKQGALRTSEIRRLEAELPDLDFKLRLPEYVDRIFRGLELSVTEWRVVSYVGPDMTVGQIAALCNLTDSAIRKVVHRLLAMGLVERVETSRRRITPIPFTASRKRARPNSLSPARNDNRWH